MEFALMLVRAHVGALVSLVRPQTACNPDNRFPALFNACIIRTVAQTDQLPRHGCA